MVDHRCQFTGHRQGDSCLVCGYVIAHDLRVPLHRRCSGQPTAHPRRGLGDFVAALLRIFGISKQRYSALRKLLHLAPGCGCDRRRNQLNAFGWSIARTAKNFFRRLGGRFYARPRKKREVSATIELSEAEP